MFCFRQFKIAFTTTVGVLELRGSHQVERIKRFKADESTVSTRFFHELDKAATPLVLTAVHLTRTKVGITTSIDIDLHHEVDVAPLASEFSHTQENRFPLWTT